MNIQISDIGHVIQLAIAPVFLLTGVGTKLTVLTNRLARIIDRSRVLEDRLDIGYHEAYMSELDMLYGRCAPDQLRDHAVDRLRPDDLPGHRDAVPGRHHQPAAGQIHRRPVRAGDARA